MGLEWKMKGSVHYLCDAHLHPVAWVEHVGGGWLCCAPGGYSVIIPTEEEAKAVVYTICRMEAP